MRLAAIAVVIALAGLAIWRCQGHEAPPARPDAAVVTKARLKLRELQRRPAGNVRGKVEAAGRAIADALVCARDPDDDLRCVATTATGDYELALRPAAYQLWASAAGFAGTRRADKLALAPGETRTGIDFELSRGDTELAGHVGDTRRRDVANALVTARIDGDPTASVRTDARGNFRIWVRGGEATVEATADGYVDARVSTAVPASGLALVLVPEATLAGIVVEAGTRTPIAGARVSLAGLHVTSGDDGAFRLTKLSPGRYKPTASSIGGYGEARDSVLLRVGAHVEGVVIEVHPVAVVAGRIVIEGSERGCPEGAGNVMLERRGSRELAFGETILEGEVLIEGVVPGVYAVRLGCAGYLPAASYPDLVVGGTDVEDVVWPVKPGGALAGRVRTKAGEPVEDAAVTVNAGLGTGARVRTDRDGTFEATGLPPGEVTVEAIQLGYAQSEAVTATISLTATTRVELVLGDRTGGVAGTVVDRAGLPVANARVEARTGDATAGPSDTTDVHGAFEIIGLEPGTYGVVVESAFQLASDSRVLAPPVEVRVARGAPARVQLQIERDASRITGTVVDDRGAPVADVAIDVALTSADVEPRRRSYERTLAWTSATGGFELAGLPDHPVAVRARIDGANEVVVDNVQPGQHALLVLRSTGAISGVVADPTGASVDDVTLEIEDRAQDISRRERLFHTGGAFAFRDLPAGTYRITADEDRQTQVIVTLAHGERREGLQLALRPRHAIKGRLVDTSGKPLPNYKLEVPHKEAVDQLGKGRTIATWETEVAATNARGEFLIQGLVGAEVTISAGNLAAGPDPSLVEVKTVPLVGPPTIELGDLVMPAPSTPQRP